MKKNLLFKVLLIAALLQNVAVSGQILEGFNLSPGLGCNAAQASSPGPGLIDLPFPHGITYAELTHLSTKFFTSSSTNAGFTITIWSELAGLLSYDFNTASIPNTWQETGNLLNDTINPGVWYGQFGPYYGYEELRYSLGSDLIKRVWLRAPNFNGGVLKIDDTRINNILINYDDCNNNGVIDYYECNASTPESEKRYVCHNGNSICVNSSAVNAHLNHGDYLGPCQINNRPGLIDEPINTPKEFKITSFPNPVISSMTINYELPADSRINIELFDISGKAITVIANEQKTAGFYTHSFNAGKLAPGLYYCQLSAVCNGKTFVKGQKIMVVK